MLAAERTAPPEFLSATGLRVFATAPAAFGVAAPATTFFGAALPKVGLASLTAVAEFASALEWMPGRALPFAGAGFLALSAIVNSTSGNAAGP